MTEPPALITPGEWAALQTLLDRALAAADPPITRALLFGSKARGDFDEDSDIDLLLICDLPPEERDEAGRILARDARIVSRETGLRIETWTVTTADLEVGARTPMLVDAIADGITLWPDPAPPLRITFTPSDARFCVRCLLDWVDAGGDVVRRALADGRRAEAAQRARDDITRLAAAALLLDGETRHRRVGSLRLFAARFLETGYLPAAIRPALDWAAAAYPATGSRGSGRPPPTPFAIATADHGFRLAAQMATILVPELEIRCREDR